VQAKPPRLEGCVRLTEIRRSGEQNILHHVLTSACSSGRPQQRAPC
jgi:hypothetical protein